MGQVHNAIQGYPGLQRVAQLSLGLGRDVEGLARLGETLTPVWNPWGQPEHYLHRGELLCWGRNIEVAGGAGTRSKLEIHNPAGSNVLFVVDRVWVHLGAAGALLLALGGATQLTSDDLGLAVRDMRGNQPRTQTTQRSETSAGAPTGSNTWAEIGIATANDGKLIELDIILAPGFSLYAYPNADQVAITMSVFGRERRTIQGELGR